MIGNVFEAALVREQGCVLARSTRPVRRFMGPVRTRSSLHKWSAPNLSRAFTAPKERLLRGTTGVFFLVFARSGTFLKPWPGAGE